MQLNVQSRDLSKFSRVVSQTSVLNFNARTSNNFLLFGPPRDQISTKIDGYIRIRASVINIKSIKPNNRGWILKIVVVKWIKSIYTSNSLNKDSIHPWDLTRYIWGWNSENWVIFVEIWMQIFYICYIWL